MEFLNFSAISAEPSVHWDAFNSNRKKTEDVIFMKWNF